MSTPVELRAMPAVGARVLESVHQHRLLTARQVRALHAPGSSLRWTQLVLADLRARGLIQCAEGPRGLSLWFITARGADAVFANGILAEPRRRVWTPGQAAGPLRAHTLAVNDTGIAFVNAARERPGDDCGALSWRHEIAHPYLSYRSDRTHLLIADALLSYLQARGRSLALHQRFIELDRGTTPVEQLASKLARYSQLRQHPSDQQEPDEPGWRVYYRSFPEVLVVLADQSSEHARRRIQKTLALYSSDPARERYGTVPIAFTTLADLLARGPFASIFICAGAPEQYVDWLGDRNTKTNGRAER